MSKANGKKEAIQSKFQAVQKDLEGCVLERATEILVALLALLTGEHLVFLGAPGVAKSLLIRSLALRITGCEYFEKLLTQFTEPNELFGPVDLNAYQQGQYTRISKKSLSQAHVGFLDEIFKANSAILNALLTLANERLLQEVGSDPVKVPLLSLFGASNETPQDSSLGALYDRFCFRVLVNNVQEESSFEALLTSSFGSTVNATLTFDDIKAAQQEVKAVTISKETIAACKSLRQELSKQGLSPSDRKWVQIGRILRAIAWLDGRAETDVEDLSVLTNVLWSDPKDIKAVQRAVYQIANPINLRSVEVEDQLQEIADQLDSNSSGYQQQLENALQQTVDILERFVTEVEASKVRDITRAEQAVEAGNRIRRKLAQEYYKRAKRLGLDTVSL